MYQVKYVIEFAKLTKGINKSDIKRIKQAIDGLGSNPYPRGFKPLKGKPGYNRIRVGDYRVIYTVSNAELIIIVIRIGHRRNVYQ